jgi:perilipin-2
MVSTPTENAISTNPPLEIPSFENPQQMDNASQSFLGRVMSYPTVSSMLDTAKGYYSNAKDSSYIVKKGCETLEYNIEGTMKYVVNPVLENNLAKPLIATADSFGCKQLDKLEKLSEEYQPSINALKEKANSIAESSIKTVEPIDQYLKSSYLAKPLNVAMDITENIVDRYIPEKKQEEKKNATDDTSATTTEETTISPGPIFRSGKVAKRLQQEAMTKLSNLSLRDKDTLSNYHYIVDLIQYAAKNLDSGVESTSKIMSDSITKGVEYSKESVKYVSEKAPKIKEAVTEQTKEKMQTLTNDAMRAVMSAIELIGNHLPDPVTQTSHNLYTQVRALPLRIEDANMEFYSALMTKNAQKLREAGALLSNSLSHLSTSTILPSSILQNVRSTLYGIYQSYASKDYTNTSTNTNDDQTTKQEQ